MSEPPQGPGILISQADCPQELEPEFDAWYDDEHIPIRLALPEFELAERYHAIDARSQRHLVLYHLSDVAVLQSAAYEDVKHGTGNTPLTRRMLGAVHNFTRFVGKQVADTHPAVGRSGASPHVLLLLYDVPPQTWPELDQRYEQEFLPRLNAVDGWDRCRRYHLVGSGDDQPNLAVLHEVSSVAALESASQILAGHAPWGEKQVASYRRRIDRRNAVVT